MIRNTMIVAALLTLCLLAADKASAVTAYFTFPDLAIEASVIAEGTVTLDQGKPVLTVSSLLKGNAANNIELLTQCCGFTPAANFTNGEHVLVFLRESTDGSGLWLVGAGDMGKWPHPKESGPYGNADIPQLASVISIIVKATESGNIEEMSRAIREMLQSDNELRQITGLDWALSYKRAERFSVKERFPFERCLAAFALRLLDSKNSAVRNAAIRLTGSAYDSVAASALIPLIADPDAYTRSLVKVALGRPIFDAKIYDAEKREKRMAKDLTLIQKNLTSASEVERESASIYLKYLGAAK